MSAHCVLATIVVLTLIIICGEAMRTQGTRRVPVREFYTSASFPLAPYNLWCGLRAAGSSATPYPAMETHFPRHNVLRSAWRDIRDEALAIYNGGLATKIKGDQFFRGIADDGWKKFYIKWYGPPGEDAFALCPRTCAILRGLPEVSLAMFSVLEPGSRIRPHIGPFRGAKRYHLGLSCPPEARILVDGVAYTWRDGDDVLFDDTYVHEVVNKSATRPRIVLFCDVVTVMADPVSDWINRSVCSKLGPLTTRANSKNETTGPTSE